MEKIAAYKLSDGRIFEDKEAAEGAEKYAEFSLALRGFLNEEIEDEQRAGETHEILTLYSKEIHSILNTLHG